MAKFALSLIGAVAALAMIAAPASAGKEKNKTIVDKVVGISGASGFDDNAGDFDILREAVVATGLDGLLGWQAAAHGVRAARPGVPRPDRSRQ